MVGLRSVGLGWVPPGAASSHWFLRVHIDCEVLTVDKAAFVSALAAEGIPCSVEYRAMPSEAKWFTEQNTYGTSGYPWTASAYTGDRHPTFSCPNCDEAVETHFSIPVHENYSEQEAGDFAAALRKVEEAYLK